MDRVSTGDELNIILLRLVEYLGHTNPLVCGLAYDEVCDSCLTGEQHSLTSLDPTFVPTFVVLRAPTASTVLAYVGANGGPRPAASAADRSVSF